MLKRFIKLLTPPVFPEDEDKTRKASYVHWIVLAILVLTTAFETVIRPILRYTGFDSIDWFVIVLAIASGAGLAWLRRGHVRSTSIVLVVFLWVASNWMARSYGIRDASYIINFATILMAGLLLSWKPALFFTALSIGSGLYLASGEQSGALQVRQYPVTSFASDISFVFGLNAVLIWLLIGGLESALKKTRLSVEELASSNSILNFTQSELQNRSNDLVVANKQLQTRSQKLHGIAEVARITTAIRNFDQLLPAIASAISEQLGYYYVGLFLLDEEKQYAILRSANTLEGLKMLNRGHRVPVGSINPVGYIAQTGKARVTRMSEDSKFIGNIDFPETRSQIVLPLGAGDNIIGILDIQSREANAFGEDDLATLSIMSDQVTIAIQNVLLYERSQTALREAGVVSRETSSQAWNEYGKTIQTRGYRYDGIKSEPLKDAKSSRKDIDALSIPIQLRDQTIGCLKLKSSDPAREWTEDELLMIRATADRVALALEGVRLLDEAQKRAKRETFLSEITAKLGTSFQLDSILRDTVEELGQNLKNSTITFQLVNPSAPPAPEPQKSNGTSAEGTTGSKP
jgi:GAF domain-containing protein